MPIPAVVTEPAPRVLDVPVVLVGFNRAAYLGRVCASLLRQRGLALDPRRVFLVQDGGVSPRSGVRYAEEAELAASVAAFREHFPRGHVAVSPVNIGIAANIRRAEVLAFEALDADCAYFLEDDLELGPEYLRIMEGLRALSERDPRIGYFAAYGDHRAQPPGPEAWLIMMQHHWAFGLRREPWRRLRAWMAPYDRLLEASDYPWRDHIGIFRWQEGLDIACSASSQDGIKTLGCSALGIARVMTDVCFGRYIGEDGASFYPRKFREMGYDRMAWVEGAEHRLAEGVDAQVGGILKAQREYHEGFRANELARLIAERAASQFECERVASAEDVEALFRALMDRLPDPAQRDQIAGRHTVRQVREMLLGTREFRGRSRLLA